MAYNNPNRYQSAPRPSGQPRGEIADDGVVQYWPDYLKSGYFDPDQQIFTEYVSRERVEPLVERMANAFPRLTSHQLRRYFQHCRAIETRLKSGAATWDQVRADVLKLDVAAADAFGKDPRKIPALFHDFVRRNVRAIHNERDFLGGFLPHFEALVGFGSQYLQKKEKN